MKLYVLHVLFHLSSLLADSDSDSDNELKMLYAVFARGLVK